MRGCYCGTHDSSALSLAFPLSQLELVRKRVIKHPSFLSVTIPEYMLPYVFSQITKIQTLVKVLFSYSPNNLLWNRPLVVDSIPQLMK